MKNGRPHLPAVASRSPLLRRAAFAFGLSLALSTAALFLLAGPGDDDPTLASEGGASEAGGWAPAPLLALLIVASMSALVLLVSFQPRRG